MRFGIILQGRVSPWTPHIINEYKSNFPNAEILLSTWNDQNTDDINCDFLKIKSPGIAGKSESTVNFQIVGTQAGLKNINADIVLKCRSDQFIHNREIFQIFLENALKTDRIMVPDIGTYEIINFRTSDFCQIAKKSTMENFWLSIPLYDESNYEEAGVYLTKNYVKNLKHDSGNWKDIFRKYFCVKSYFDDFQIEWEKLNQFDKYQKIFFDSYSQRALPE